MLYLIRETDGAKGRKKLDTGRACLAAIYPLATRQANRLTVALAEVAPIWRKAPSTTFVLDQQHCQPSQPDQCKQTRTLTIFMTAEPCHFDYKSASGKLGKKKSK